LEINTVRWIGSASYFSSDPVEYSVQALNVRLSGSGQYLSSHPGILNPLLEGGRIREGELRGNRDAVRGRVKREEEKGKKSKGGTEYKIYSLFLRHTQTITDRMPMNNAVRKFLSLSLSVLANTEIILQNSHHFLLSEPCLFTTQVMVSVSFDALQFPELNGCR
jgi:hypothetical protein